MRLLIDILHPAHVHFFRHFVGEMRTRGHEVDITARDKDGSTDLLRAFGLPFTQLSVQRNGVIGLGSELVQRTARLYRYVRRHRPDVLTGIMGPSIVLAGRATRTPAVVYYDTEFAWQTNWFVYPLANVVRTPACYAAPVRGRHESYRGYHELAYLHPNRFVPDVDTLCAFGLSASASYAVVRFVSWQASHDIVERGLDLDAKRRLVAHLSERVDVCISSETTLPPDLEPLRLRGPKHLVHHVIAHARLLVGESATMASEAAVLGVPAVYVAASGRGYTDEQERRYGLVRNVRSGVLSDVLGAVDDVLRTDPGAFTERRRALLHDTVDVTALMVDDFEREHGGAA